MITLLYHPLQTQSAGTSQILLLVAEGLGYHILGLLMEGVSEIFDREDMK